MNFPQELEWAAFRTDNGEYAWRRSDVPDAVHALADAGRVVLGGDIWVVVGSAVNEIPRLRSGTSAVIHWSCDRQPAESWENFVQRSVTEAISAIDYFGASAEPEIDTPANGRILYGLVWCTEEEFDEL